MRSNKRRDGRGRSGDRLKGRIKGKHGVWANRAGLLSRRTKNVHACASNSLVQPSEAQVSEKRIAQTLDSACSQQMNEVNREEIVEIGPVKKRRHFLSLHGAFKCLIIFNSM